LLNSPKANYKISTSKEGNKHTKTTTTDLKYDGGGDDDSGG
jgi:hypothetical protein